MSKSKAKGTAWESLCVAYLRLNGWPLAERRTMLGAHDRGDIAGLISTVIECKSVSQASFGVALAEAEAERDRDHARYGVVWAKRRGSTDPGKAFVVMTGADFVKLLRDAQGLDDVA